MNEPTDTHPPAEPVTTPRLLAALAELHDVAAAVAPELVDLARVTWSIGYPSGALGIRAAVIHDGGTALTELHSLLGGSITPSRGTYDNAGRQWRLHDLHVTWRGIAVRITASLPEPTEREALLARLAELDAEDARAAEQRHQLDPADAAYRHLAPAAAAPAVTA